MELSNRKRLLGWAGIVAAIAITSAAMGIASATGLAKTPSTSTLEAEEPGGNASSDSSDTADTGASTATVDVTLSEWSIVPSVKSVKAGAITFNIQNAGQAKSHEFIILKTDIAPESLPTLKDGSLDEEGNGITSPGEGKVLPVGKKQTITVPMTEGKYVFVDNIIEKDLVHWQKKAYAAFTVEAPDSAGASGSPGETSVVSLTSPVSAGQNADIKVQTSPGASCSIVYTHPSGKTSTATGLDPKTADADGTVTWTWLISKQTQPLGNGKVLVTCGGKSAEAIIAVQ